MSLLLSRSDSEACAASHASSLAPPDLPISVTCWVYVEAQPGVGETHTVWWYGRDGIDSQFIKLAFLADTEDAIRFQATFQAGNNTATATATGYATGAWHCISIVVEERTNPSEYRLRLYVDAAAPQDDSTTASGALVNDYDIFALGRTSGATKTDYASCNIEQVAAWQGATTNPVLGEGDNETMFNGRIPPRDAKDAAFEIEREPDLAYWILAGHARNGLSINDDQDDEQRGELTNELGFAFPAQQIQSNTSAPRWSAKTPIFRWKDVKKPQQGIRDLPRKAPRSRLQPRFVFFQGPSFLRSSKFWPVSDPDPLKDRPSPVWEHPNFEHLGQTRAGNAGALRPDEQTSSATNRPKSDLAVAAISIADWFAYQGFAAGAGSEQGGAYEGSIFVRGIGLGGVIVAGEPGEEVRTLRGWDLPEDHPDNPFGIAGEYNDIPLSQHPFDHIDQATGSAPEVEDIWNVWYMDHGVRLCREWSEHFWQALKEELDERGLCYPARLHWDYEEQPNWNTAMSPPPGPIGNWGAMLSDPRATDGDHPVYVEPGVTATEWTFAQVDDTRTVTLHPDKDPWQENIGATNWLGGWIVAMRNSALHRGVIEPATEQFEHTKWSNYFDFVADNSDFTFPRRGPAPGQSIVAFSFNTPPAIHADYSSPVLYIVSRRDLFMEHDSIYHYGATPSSVSRGLIRARIDACINARNPLPVTPWIGGPLHKFSDPTYETTFEDSFDSFAYAWQRGITEFIVFAWSPNSKQPANDAWDQAWFVCNRLLDWVHMLPQAASGTRVARMSRLGRRQ